MIETRAAFRPRPRRAPPARGAMRRPAGASTILGGCRARVREAQCRVELLLQPPRPWLVRVITRARLIELAALVAAGVGILVGLVVGAPAASLAATTYWLRLAIVVGGTWLIARGVGAMAATLRGERPALLAEAQAEFYHACRELARIQGAAACPRPSRRR